MTWPLIITVDGKPKGKGRPRHTRSGVTYTPADTRNTEAYIRMLARQEMMAKELTALDVPVVLTVVALFLPPSGWSKSRKQAAVRGEIAAIGRKDLDNIVKLVSDALNKTAYRDDALITRLVAEKRYGTADCTIIDVRPA